MPLTAPPAALLLLPLAACVVAEPPAAEVGQASAEELLASGDGYFDARQYELALGAYKMAAVAASGAGERERLVEATSQVAHTHALRGELELGREWLARAEERGREEEPVAWARLLLARGALARAAGDDALAGESFEAAWRFALDTEQPVRAVQGAHLRAVVSRGPDRARWTRRAIEAAEVVENPRLSSQLWGQLAWLLEEQGLSAEALTAFQRARELVLGLEDEHLVLVADWSLGHGLRLAGRPAEARILLEDVAARAERRYVTRRRPNDAEWVGHAQRELAELDLVDGQPRRALARLERAHDHLLEAGAEELAPEVLRAVRKRIAELEELPSSASRSQ